MRFLFLSGAFAGSMFISPRWLSPPKPAIGEFSTDRQIDSDDECAQFMAERRVAEKSKGRCFLCFFFPRTMRRVGKWGCFLFLIALDAGYIYYCRWYIWMMLRLDVVGRRFIVASLPEFVVSNFRPCDRLWSLSGNPTWCRFACQRPQGRFCVSSSREKAMSRDGLVGRTTTQEFKTENWW